MMARVVDSPLGAVKSPPEIVAEFLASLPATVRNVVAAMVYGYVVRPECVNSDTDFVAELTDLLTRGKPLARRGILICVIASLDHSLIGAYYLREFREKSLADLARENASAETLRMEAQAPLNSRHFDDAWKRWKGLRESILTPQTLHAYERDMIEHRGR